MVSHGAGYWGLPGLETALGQTHYTADQTSLRQHNEGKAHSARNATLAKELLSRSACAEQNHLYLLDNLLLTQDVVEVAQFHGLIVEVPDGTIQMQDPEAIFCRQ